MCKVVGTGTCEIMVPEMGTTRDVRWPERKASARRGAFPYCLPVSKVSAGLSGYCPRPPTQAAKGENGF
jgi:hypothetical protein